MCLASVALATLSMTTLPSTAANKKTEKAKKNINITQADDGMQIGALGPNPFITHIYTADPSAHVWSDGRLYVYPSHDIDPPRGCDRMDKYHVFSTDDMAKY